MTSMGGTQQVQRVHLPFTESERQLIGKLIRRIGRTKVQIDKVFCDELKAMGCVQRLPHTVKRFAKKQKMI